VHVPGEQVIFIATSRNSNLKSEFGGTPFNLIKGARESGYMASGIDLAPWWLLHLFRFFWRLWRIVNFKSPFGWQYSEISNWARGKVLNSKLTESDSLISFFQIVPKIDNPYVIYTDCSLKFIFDHYPESLRVPNDIRERAIKLEQETYANAKLIFLKTQEAIRDLNSNYGIPLNKLILQTVPPNNVITISDKVLRNRQFLLSQEIRFIFIGKDGARKGLDRALEVLRNLQRNGVSLRLDVVGTYEFRDSTFDLENIYFHGKLESGSKILVGLLEQSHFGFLLSRSEAAGISLIEFQAAGIIPIISSLPGFKDNLKCRNFIQLSTSESIENLAERVLIYIQNSNLKLKLAQALEDAENFPNWQTRAQEIIKYSKFDKL
jgi:glycosyltransferase involved in cell wall biosynthesis